MLIVHNDGDSTARFSHYLRELLAVEGFASLEEIALDTLVTRLGEGSDGVVLPRMALSLEVVERLVSYVHGGGKLIAIQPDASLVKRLGLVPGNLNITNGILSLQDHALVRGLPRDSVQLIVPSCVWWPSAERTCSRIGTISTKDDPFSQYVVIWHLKVGQGEVVLFAFDLPKAVARLRHGDPDLADLPNEIYDGYYRPSDLFRGQLQPSQANVPQADVITAVLGRAIESLVPQPRVWYYPEPGQRSVLLQTSDDDWSTIDQFETMLAVLRQYDARCTFYVVNRTHLTVRHMDQWEQDGHVFSVHPASLLDVEGKLQTGESQRLWVPDMVRENVARHTKEFGRPVNTIRNHAIRWVGYVELAKLHAELGIRGEANYFTMGVVPAGFLTGSGRLVPHVDVTGEVINHLQIPSHWTEEILVSDSHGFSERWLYSRAQSVTNDLISRASSCYHTPITINSHPVSFATYSRPLIESNWKTAREAGIPIISADAWVAFTDARRNVSIKETPAGFDISADSPVEQIVVLCPEETEASGSGVTTTTEVIWGKSYTAVTVIGLAAGEKRGVRTACIDRIRP